MREYSWLERPVSWKQQSVFQSIHDRVVLARAWAVRGSLNGALSEEEVRLRVGVTVAAWLESMPLRAEREFFSEWCHSEIGGHTPEEALLELARGARIQEQVIASQIRELPGVTEVSRNEGRQACQRLSLDSSVRFSGLIPESLESLARTLQQSAMGWLDWPSQYPLLIERDVPRRLDWTLMECPHRDDLITSSTLADFLCAQHTEWMRGFAEQLDSRLAIAERPREPLQRRCRVSLTWGDGEAA